MVFVVVIVLAWSNKNAAQPGVGTSLADLQPQEASSMKDATRIAVVVGVIVGAIFLIALQIAAVTG